EVPGAKQAAMKMQAAMKNQMQAAMAKQAGAMKAAMAKQMQAAMAAKQAEMEKQMQAAMEAKQAEIEEQMQANMAAKEVGMPKEAAPNAAAANSIAPTAPKAALPAAPPLVATPCLTKEYLDNGRSVMFRDNCTGDWAQRTGGPNKNAATPAARPVIDKP